MKKPFRPNAGDRKAGKVPTRARGEAAAALAVAALSFLAQEPERLAGFLAATGLGPQSLRAAAHEAGFLGGVLEHIANDESLLLAFAAERDLDPQEVMRARDALAGPPGHTGAA